MSGHSHAKTVKRTKDANAAKKGKIFSKLSQVISLAAKEGADPSTNTRLKQALEEAKKANMPKENVERAIQRGSGELGEADLEEIVLEALGANNVMLIIDCITDNSNRTISEVRQILQKYEFKLANEGSLRWAFEQKGIILVSGRGKNDTAQKKEEAELDIIEAGADDIAWAKNGEQNGQDNIEIITNPASIEQVKQSIEQRGFSIESSFLGFRAKSTVALDEKTNEKFQQLLEALNEQDDTQRVFSNVAQ